MEKKIKFKIKSTSCVSVVGSSRAANSARSPSRAAIKSSWFPFVLIERWTPMTRREQSRCEWIQSATRAQPGSSVLRAGMVAPGSEWTTAPPRAFHLNRKRASDSIPGSRFERDRVNREDAALNVQLVAHFRLQWHLPVLRESSKHLVPNFSRSSCSVRSRFRCFERLGSWNKGWHHSLKMTLTALRGRSTMFVFHFFLNFSVNSNKYLNMSGHSPLFLT